MSRPSVCIVGAGAAGLWCAIHLVRRGWRGDRLTIVEPDAKTSNDHTWSYWTCAPLLPAQVDVQRYYTISLRSGERSATYETQPYWYETIRSEAFYTYAKEVLAKAEVKWLRGEALGIETLANRKVEVRYRRGERIDFVYADYALDSRSPTIDVACRGFHTTLQHFGGWFVRSDRAAFDPRVATFMDFVEVDGAVAFFYVLPKGARSALVEVAVFSAEPWTPGDYDEAIEVYLENTIGLAADRYTVTEREYGVIPMTDQPLWEDSTARVWKIGTAAGWVQPSSGYAFARCARYAEELVTRLSGPDPRPFVPSIKEQIFNSVMLAHAIAEPSRAGETFFDLFARNGAPATFAFLDDRLGAVDTMKLMWRSPRAEFTRRAMREILAHAGLRLDTKVASPRRHSAGQLQ